MKKIRLGMKGRLKEREIVTKKKRGHTGDRRIIGEK